jgi:hypothetical protein
MRLGLSVSDRRSSPLCGCTDSGHYPVVSSTCGCNFFTLDTLADHVSPCAIHSGDKKTHDWVVEQLVDMFQTTHKV